MEFPSLVSLQEDRKLIEYFSLKTDVSRAVLMKGFALAFLVSFLSFLSRYVDLAIE